VFCMNSKDIKKTVTINGDNFVDFESFYNEIDRVCTHGLKWRTGHNLNAFNDLLKGGFGVYEYEEPINLVWINFERSIELMGPEHIGWIVDIINEHKHIHFSKID
jgi:RNAse (barnase) inhibitor barstar